MESFNNIEFFIYESNVMIRFVNGEVKQLKESDIKLINFVLDMIQTYYPKAYHALAEEYKACRGNVLYFNYRVVLRFIKCNYAALDNMPDIEDDLLGRFEYVPCPLRGECKHECVICRPEFDSELSEAEKRVMRRWKDNQTVEGIAADLYLSPHTVNNHIRHSYKKLGVHSKSEFIVVAEKYKFL